MGASNQLAVFVCFGLPFVEQFEVCKTTIQRDWNVVILTDVDVVYDNNNNPNIYYIKVPTPETQYDILTFRKNIPDYININKYSQIWYFDSDILFAGDILKKYKNTQKILVSNEPFSDITNEFMSSGLSELEIKLLKSEFAPAINSGCFCVPACQYDFFDKYKLMIEDISKLPLHTSVIDQSAMNNLYHRKICEMELFDVGDIGFPTRETTGKYVNHYIGMGLYKLNLMKDKLGIAHG